MGIYEDVECGKCGCRFGLTTAFKNDKMESCDTFYCPNGHPRAYVESTSDKLRRERDHLKQQEARLLEEKQIQIERALKAEKQVKTLKKRAAAGTCPCCQRTFKNMAEHMKHQHPQFVCDTGAKVVPIKRTA